MVKKILIALCIVGLLLSFSGCSFESNNTDNDTQQTIANEASIYCESNGGTLEIVPDEGGEWGKCNFDDGSFCEEWSYYHGECSPGRGNGNTLGINEIKNNADVSGEFVNLVEDLGEQNLINTGNDTKSNGNNIEIISNNCPQDDIKKCEDGTFLVREGPNCEYGTCPGYPLNDDFVQSLLHKYENNGSELHEDDINLMNEIINVITQI